MIVRRLAHWIVLCGLTCSVPIFAQDQPQATPTPTPTPSPTPPPARPIDAAMPRPSALKDVAPSTAAMRGDVEILSDTQGLDFGPYIQRALLRIKMNWYNLVPEVAKPPLRKKGNVIVQFTILKDGKVAGMLLQQPSGDVYLDRAAWGGINDSSPFERLPPEFKGSDLALRIKFRYNIAPDATPPPAAASAPQK